MSCWSNDTVSEEVAILAKKKGFDEITADVNCIKAESDPLDAYGCRNSQLPDNYITYPKLFDLQRWLREKHSIQITIDYTPHIEMYNYIIHYKINGKSSIENGFSKDYNKVY